MEVIFEAKEMTPRLALAAKVVSNKNALPILDNVLMHIYPDKAILTTSDSEVWLSVKCPIKEQDGEAKICINAHDFLLALRNLDDDSVRMVINENNTITCHYNNGRFSMPYENADEFPMSMATMENSTTQIIYSKNLLRDIERVGFATANDELRPVMNGIHFDIMPNAIITASSDGQKLARYCDSAVTVTAEGQPSFTLPKKPANIAMSVLSTTDGDVKIEFTDKAVVISNESFKLTARLIEGRYPDYNRVIPKECKAVATISRGDMIAALRRVLPMGNEKSELVALQFGDQKVVVSAEDFDFSKSAHETVLCSYRGEDLLIGFKGSILLLLLQSIDATYVTIEMTEPSRAAVCYGDNKDEYLSLIMPMLIN